MHRYSAIGSYESDVTMRTKFRWLTLQHSATAATCFFEPCQLSFARNRLSLSSSRLQWSSRYYLCHEHKRSWVNRVGSAPVIVSLFFEFIELRCKIFHYTPDPFVLLAVGVEIIVDVIDIIETASKPVLNFSATPWTAPPDPSGIHNICSVKHFKGLRAHCLQECAQQLPQQLVVED